MKKAKLFIGKQRGQENLDGFLDPGYLAQRQQGLEEPGPPQGKVLPAQI
jgi:hypothetical protein